MSYGTYAGQARDRSEATPTENSTACVVCGDDADGLDATRRVPLCRDCGTEDRVTVTAESAFTALVALNHHLWSLGRVDDTGWTGRIFDARDELVGAVPIEEFVASEYEREIFHAKLCQPTEVEDGE